MKTKSQESKEKSNKIFFSEAIRKNMKKLVMVCLLVILFFTWSLWKKYIAANPNFEYITVPLETRTLQKSIEIDGEVYAQYQIDLASEIPGVVKKIEVMEGEMVSEGQDLVRLSDIEYRGIINSAYAEKSISQAQLEAVENPNQNSQEDLEISLANKQSLEESMEKIKEQVAADIQELSIRLDQILLYEIDDYFAHTSQEAVFTFRLRSESSEEVLEEQRDKLGDAFEEYKVGNRDLTSSVLIIKDFEDMLLSLQEQSLLFLGVGKSITEERYKNLSSLRSEIIALRTSLSQQENDISLLEKDIDVSQKETDKVQNAYSQYDAKLALEKLKKSRVAVNNAYRELKRTVLTSPREGMVARLLKEEGEFVKISEHVLTIVSPERHVRAFVPEIDIIKVTVGMHVDVYFDSLIGEKFSGQISFIYPIKKEIKGISYFEIKVELMEDINEFLVLPGMSAQVNIPYIKKENVFSLERGVAQQSLGDYFVTVENKDRKSVFEDAFVQKSFDYGFVGDKYVEVLGGLSSKDTIIHKVNY